MREQTQKNNKVWTDCHMRGGEGEHVPKEGREGEPAYPYTNTF